MKAHSVDTLLGFEKNAAGSAPSCTVAAASSSALLAYEDIVAPPLVQIPGM
jgi:hypothetical protein